MRYRHIDRQGEFSLFGCPAGTIDITISEDGEVYRCIRYQEKEKSLGNVLMTSFKDIWKHNNDTLVLCEEECDNKSVCGGKCNLSKFSKTN